MLYAYTTVTHIASKQLQLPSKPCSLSSLCSTTPPQHARPTAVAASASRLGTQVRLAHERLAAGDALDGAALGRTLLDLCNQDRHDAAWKLFRHAARRQLPLPLPVYHKLLKAAGQVAGVEEVQQVLAEQLHHYRRASLPVYTTYIHALLKCARRQKAAAGVMPRAYHLWQDMQSGALPGQPGKPATRTPSPSSSQQASSTDTPSPSPHSSSSNGSSSSSSETGAQQGVSTQGGVGPRTLLATSSSSSSSSSSRRGPHKPPDQLAYEAWLQLQGSGQLLDGHAYLAGIHACVAVGRLPEAQTLLELLRLVAGPVHPLLLAAYNLLLAAHSRAGDQEAARKLFLTMKQRGLQPDLVTYNTLMGSFAAAGQLVRARAVLDKAKREGVAPDAYSYTILMGAAAAAGDAGGVLGALRDMTAAGVLPTRVTFGVLLDFYASSRDLVAAGQLLLQLEARGPAPNRQMYNSQLKGLLQEQRLRAREQQQQQWGQQQQQQQLGQQQQQQQWGQQHQQQQWGQQQQQQQQQGVGQQTTTLAGGGVSLSRSSSSSTSSSSRGGRDSTAQVPRQHPTSPTGSSMGGPLPPQPPSSSSSGGAATNSSPPSYSNTNSSNGSSSSGGGGGAAPRSGLPPHLSSVATTTTTTTSSGTGRLDPLQELLSVSGLLRHMAARGVAPGTDTYTLVLNHLVEVGDTRSVTALLQQLEQLGLQLDIVALTSLLAAAAAAEDKQAVLALFDLMFLAAPPAAAGEPRGEPAAGGAAAARAAAPAAAEAIPGPRPPAGAGGGPPAAAAVPAAAGQDPATAAGGALQQQPAGPAGVNGGTPQGLGHSNRGSNGVQRSHSSSTSSGGGLRPSSSSSTSSSSNGGAHIDASSSRGSAGGWARLPVVKALAEPDVVAWTGLVAALVKCNCMAEAEAALERCIATAAALQQPVPAKAFGLLINGYKWRRRQPEALALLRRLLQLGGKPSAQDWDEVMQLCVQVGEVKAARQVLRAMKLTGALDKGAAEARILAKYEQQLTANGSSSSSGSSSGSGSTGAPGGNMGVERLKWWFGLPNRYYPSESESR